jgi:hypothetical protein
VMWSFRRPKRSIERARTSNRPPKRRCVRPHQVGRGVGARRNRRLRRLIVLAVRNQRPDWNAWLSMAVGIGVLAGVFFGLLAGFMRTSHLFK